MKYCIKCGTPNENDQSRFCHKCGAEFPVQYVQAPVSGQTYSAAAPSPEPARKNKKVVISIVVIAAVIVLALSIMFAAGVFSNLFDPVDSDDEEAYSDKDSDEDEDDEDGDGNESDSSDKSSGGLISGLSSLFGNSNHAEPEKSPAETPAAESTTAPYEGAGQLIVWSSTDQVQTILDRAMQMMPNLRCEFLSIPYEEYDVKLRTSMAAGDAPDVFTLDHPYPKAYMDLDSLLDLSDLESEAISNGTMDYTIEYGRDSYGTLRALAWQVSPGGMFYRRSLASKYLGTDDPNEVQSMFSDVNRLYDTAGVLYANSNGKCKLTSATDLITPSLSLRSNPWITNGSLTVDNSLIDFLEIYKNLKDNDYLSDCRQWDENWFSAINDGMTDAGGNPIEEFSYFLPKWGLEYVIKPNATGKSDTTGDWAMINGPFSYFMGGSWVCADKNTDNSEAAKALIRYMTLNKDFLEDWSRETKDIVPNISVNDTVRQNGMDTFISGQDLYQVLNDISQNIDGTLYTQYDQQIESFWNTHVESYINDLETLEEAVEGFRNDVTSNLGVN